MATRSIASLSLSFGLVSIPVKLYSATESAAAIRFKLMSSSGARLRQQYVSDAPDAGDEPADAAESVAAAEAVAEPAPMPAPARSAASRVVDFPSMRRDIPAPAPEPVEEPPAVAPAVVERSEMVKGYEFEKGKFVLFSADELKALEEGSRHTIDIVAFIPASAVDPLYYDKAYFLAPDKRGAKPYSLLLRAMQDTGQCALAKWAFRAKEYVVQIRPTDGGMVLQQLLYAEEVRPIADLHVELVDVGDAELALAKKLIEQISAPSYDPLAFVDEEKQRILAAVERKIAGQEVVAPGESIVAKPGADVVDLVAALRASLQPSAVRQTEAAVVAPAKAAETAESERKPVRRARKAAPAEAVPEVEAVSAKRRSGRR